MGDESRPCKSNRWAALCIVRTTVAPLAQIEKPHFALNAEISRIQKSHVNRALRFRAHDKATTDFSMLHTNPTPVRPQRAAWSGAGGFEIGAVKNPTAQNPSTAAVRRHRSKPAHFPAVWAVFRQPTAQQMRVRRMFHVEHHVFHVEHRTFYLAASPRRPFIITPN